MNVVMSAARLVTPVYLECGPSGGIEVTMQASGLHLDANAYRMQASGLHLSENAGQRPVLAALWRMRICVNCAMAPDEACVAPATYQAPGFAGRYACEKARGRVGVEANRA